MTVPCRAINQIRQGEKWVFNRWKKLFVSLGRWRTMRPRGRRPPAVAEPNGTCPKGRWLACGFMNNASAHQLTAGPRWLRRYPGRFGCFGVISPDNFIRCGSLNRVAAACSDKSLELFHGKSIGGA